MPSMTIHRSDQENAFVTYSKSIPRDLGWIAVGKENSGDYLVIYLDSEEPSMRFLIELETAIQQSLAHLVALRMEGEFPWKEEPKGERNY